MVARSIGELVRTVTGNGLGDSGVEAGKSGDSGDGKGV